MIFSDYISFHFLDKFDGINPEVKSKDLESIFENRKTFTKIKYEVATLERQVFPGNYTFPFKMTVDPNRPPSTTVSTIFKIFYKLKAQVSGLPELGKVSQTIFVELFNPISLPIVPVQVHKEEMLSSYFCCFSPKNLICTALIDKNAYAAGETVTVTLLADASNFSKDMEVTVEMIQKVISNKIPALKPLQTKLAETRMPIIPAGKTVKHTIMMTIPLNNYPTLYTGCMLKALHFIEIKVFPGTCGLMIIPLHFTIYQSPKLEPAPPVSLPPSRIEEVHEPVLLLQSKIIYPY